VFKGAVRKDEQSCKRCTATDGDGTLGFKAAIGGFLRKLK
jgi:hypothetical protein